MFIPAFIKKEKNKELLLELPNYFEEYQKYINNKQEQNKKETVIHIQIY
jgi:hypothetical protein